MNSVVCNWTLAASALVSWTLVDDVHMDCYHDGDA